MIYSLKVILQKVQSFMRLPNGNFLEVIIDMKEKIIYDAKLYRNTIHQVINRTKVQLYVLNISLLTCVSVLTVGKRTSNNGTSFAVD